MQRAAIIKIDADGVCWVGRDEGGSAPQRGRLEVRSGGGVVWAPLADNQETAQVPPAVQGMAPGEVPQPRPPAPGHAAGVASEAQSPPPAEAKTPAAPVGTPPTPSGPAAPGVTTPGPDPVPASEGAVQ